MSENASSQHPGESTAPRGLLAIFAHPDDESYGAGGVMALAASAGNPVWVLCATNGDQGGRPGVMDVDHSLDPEIRRRELESGRLRTVLSEAVWASYRRTVELGSDLEKGLGLNEGAASAPSSPANGAGNGKALGPSRGKTKASARSGT